jgi:hypothetical protein
VQESSEFDSKVLVVDINEILSPNVEDLIRKIFDRFRYPLATEKIEHVIDEHRKMIQLQQSLRDMETIKGIIDAIQQQQHLAYPRLSLAAEAVLQRRLHHAGYELLCFDLDEIPLDTTALRRILKKK